MGGIALLLQGKRKEGTHMLPSFFRKKVEKTLDFFCYMLYNYN